MTWRVLDFTSFNGRLSYTRGRIKAEYRDGNRKTVSLAEIAIVTIANNVDISSGLLGVLGEKNIPVIITDWRKVPLATSAGWSTHTRVGARQIAQANLSLPKRKQAWASLVRAKVLGQAQTLQALGLSAASNHLHKLALEVRSGDPTNIEAQAARLYWRYFSDESFHRNQDGIDFVNIALNYGYTVLRGHCIRAVTEAGLWPALGVFHHSRSNGFNLADDLIEPFRPVIDYSVAQLPPDSKIEDPAVRTALVSASASQFHKDGRSVTTVMSATAQQFGRYAEGEIKQFRAESWSGPFEEAS